MRSKPGSVGSLLLVVFTGFLLSSCAESPSSNNAADTTGVCASVGLFLDKADSGEPLKPKLWGEMMLAGARLAYVHNACGDRVTVAAEELCADLNKAAQAFAASENVPQGTNRDTALSQSLQTYANAGCKPELLLN